MKKQKYAPRRDWSLVMIDWNRNKGQMSQAEFAKSRGLSVSSFYGAIKKFRDKKEAVRVKGGAGFVRVGGPEMIELETSKGTKLKIPATAAALREVLGVVEQ